MALNLPGVPFKLTPEDMGAPDYAGSLLHGVRGGMDTMYHPKQVQADIFNKTIGPLATLATAPMFLANQPFQEGLERMISEQFSRMGYGGSPANGQNSGSNTYRGNLNNAMNEATDYAKHIGEEGRGSVRASGLVGRLESYLPKTWADWVEQKTGFNSNLYEEDRIFKDNLQRQMDAAIHMGLNPSSAHTIYQQYPGEKHVQTLERIRKANPNMYDAINKPLSSGKNTVGKQDALQEQSNELSSEIQKRFKVDVPPTVIFNALSNHKGGKFDIMKWLKQNGYLRK